MKQYNFHFLFFLQFQDSKFINEIQIIIKKLSLLKIYETFNDICTIYHFANYLQFFLLTSQKIICHYFKMLNYFQKNDYLKKKLLQKN